MGAVPSGPPGSHVPANALPAHCTVLVDDEVVVISVLPPVEQWDPHGSSINRSESLDPYSRTGFLALLPVKSDVPTSRCK